MSFAGEHKWTLDYEMGRGQGQGSMALAVSKTEHNCLHTGDLKLCMKTDRVLAGPVA